MSFDPFTTTTTTMTTPLVELTNALMRKWLGRDAYPIDIQWEPHPALQNELTNALMRKWLGRDAYPIDIQWEPHPALQNALKQAAQWGYDQGQAERAAAMASLRKSATVTEAQLQEARDQQLEECCKWLEQKVGTVWAGNLRRACRPKVDDSEAADAARMRWLLKGHGYPTYLAIGEVTAWLKENDSTWNVGGDAAVDAARREIDKRMARNRQVVRQTEADE